MVPELIIIESKVFVSIVKKFIKVLMMLILKLMLMRVAGKESRAWDWKMYVRVAGVEALSNQFGC